MRSAGESHSSLRLTLYLHSGSYIEYIVTPARYTSKIPDGVADELAGPISKSSSSRLTGSPLTRFTTQVCSGSTMYAALLATKAQAGQWVVIPGGGGGVGHMGAFLSKQRSRPADLVREGTQYGKALGLRILA